MGEKKTLSRHFVVCVQNKDYEASLERHKIYAVLPDREAGKDGDIQVVDKSGKDYLYPSDWFVVVAVPKYH
jgi:hypothetical protein